MTEPRAKRSLEANSALAVWDTDKRLRWANNRFRELIPALAPSVRPGLYYDSWLYRAAAALPTTPARADRKGWIKRLADARRKPVDPFELELTPRKVFRVSEERLDDGGWISCWVDVSSVKRLRHALAESEERYRSLVELAADAVMVLAERRILFVNRRGAALFGADDPDALVGRRLDTILPATSAALFEDELPAPGVEISFRTLSGTPLPLEVRTTPFQDGDRALTLLIAHDVSARKGAEAAARGAEHRLASALESLSDVVALFDAEDRLVLANRASRELEAPVGGHWRPGIPYRDYLEAALEADLYPDASGNRRIWMEQRLARRAAPRGAVEIARQDGRWFRLNEHRLDDGGLLSIATDITEHRLSERRIHFLAHHDALTALPNRAVFMDRLRQAIRDARRNDSRVAVLMLDLDNFKHVNDNLGHAAGDHLLVELARRLRACAGDGDTVARFGGDEFAIVRPLAESTEPAETLAKRAVGALADPVVVDGRTLHTGASAGITLFPDDAPDMAALLRNADLALYRAKALSGRRRVAFYAEELSRRADERAAVAEGLRQALAEDHLVLHYQPQARLSDNGVIGGEALLRWQHPEHGLLLPGRFIEHAEASGLIIQIGEWAITRACAQLAEWTRNDLPAVPIWVNLSAAQFHDHALLETVRGRLSSAHLDPRLLGLEITESALVDARASGAIFDSLVDLGVELAIDDFGTGYSSLNYLKQLPVGKLKIDRSFVRDMTNNPHDSAIVRAIIHLGHSLGMHVLAEGIETPAQSALLSDLGCDQVQGRLIGPPLPPDDFMRFVTSRSRRRVPRI